MNEMSVRTWQERFRAGDFSSRDRAVQCEAGWYDWFCRDDALARRLKKISGVVLGYCTIGGYRRGAGKLSALGIAVSVVVMLAAVYLGNRMDIAIAASRELDLSFGQAFAWMHELVDADAYRSNLITLYLFSAIGAVPAAFNAHKIAKEKGRVYRIGE